MAINDYLSDLLQYFSSEGYLTSCYATQGNLDAIEKIKELGPFFDNIIVSGGDGTLDEVIRGLMAKNLNPVLGYIPTGSTNDFSSSLNIPQDLEEAGELALEGRETAIDIGKFLDNYFVYVAAFGAFAEVSYDTDQNLKNVFGRSAYIMEGIKSVPSLKSYEMRFNIDGEIIEGDFLQGMITNSTSVGGFKGILTEGVELSDGFFEVTLVKYPKNLVVLNRTLQDLLKANDDERVIKRRAQKVEVWSQSPLNRTIDGEYGGSHSYCKIEVLNRRIRIRTGF